VLFHLSQSQLHIFPLFSELCCCIILSLFFIECSLCYSHPSPLTRRSPRSLSLRLTPPSLSLTSWKVTTTASLRLSLPLHPPPPPPPKKLAQKSNSHKTTDNKKLQQVLRFVFISTKGIKIKSKSKASVLIIISANPQSQYQQHTQAQIELIPVKKGEQRPRASVHIWASKKIHSSLVIRLESIRYWLAH
jgi:hypothetical protein